MDYTVHGILQARILEWVVIPFCRDLPKSGIKPRSPALQVNCLPAEPQGKPKNTGGGSLSLLQRIFSTQESNQGLLHCRRILYLSGEPPAGKESTCNVGDLGSIPGLGRSLEKGKATHSSILAWRIPCTVKSLGSQRVGPD